MINVKALADRVVRYVTKHVGLRDRDYSKFESVMDSLATGDYFITCDGRDDDSTGYYKKGPEIIKSILEDHIGIASGDINSTAFTAANGLRSHELVVYIHGEESAKDVLEEIARYSFGFFHIDHTGDYTMTVIKDSYASTNFTLYLRDIKGQWKDNLVFSRNPIKEVSKDLYFHYMYDWAFDRFNSNINRTVTTDLNLEQNNHYCAFVNDDDQADTVAEWFSGDGGTKGQFGEPKTVVELVTLNPEYLFAELGDIIKFDTEYDAVIDAFGATLSGIYFMVVEIHKNLREVKLKLLEVG